MCRMVRQEEIFSTDTSTLWSNVSRHEEDVWKETTGRKLPEDDWELKSFRPVVKQKLHLQPQTCDYNPHSSPAAVKMEKLVKFSFWVWKVELTWEDVIWAAATDVLQVGALLCVQLLFHLSVNWAQCSDHLVSWSILAPWIKLIQF